MSAVPGCNQQELVIGVMGELESAPAEQNMQTQHRKSRAEIDTKSKRNVRPM